MAWQDVDTLVVGAPDYLGRGGVFQVAWDGVSDWLVPNELSYTAPLALPGDQIGYSVAVSEEPSGSYVIVTGAPGYDRQSPLPVAPNSGAFQIFRDSGAGATPLQLVDIGGFDWGANDRIGTAVATDGGMWPWPASRMARPASDYQAYLLDGSRNWLPHRRDLTRHSPPRSRTRRTHTSTWLVATCSSRPGAGGQVGVFRDVGAGFPAAPVDQFIPTGREAGDAIGRRLPSTAAPSSSAPPATTTMPGRGAPYTQRSVALSHTYVGPNGGDWEVGSATGTPVSCPIRSTPRSSPTRSPGTSW